jgi:hypothetical protein
VDETKAGHGTNGAGFDKARKVNPVAAHGNSGWTQATKTASRMGENSSSFRSESSGILDYKLSAEFAFQHQA